MTEPEITEDVDECLPDGRLDPAAAGWSRVPLHRCNLRGARGRKKRWEYWCVTTDSHLFSLTYADIDYIGLVSVWFLDFETRREVSKNLVIPCGLGISHPDRVAGGDMRWRGLGLTAAITESAAATRLTALCRAFDADIEIAKPVGHESLNVLIPWSERRFQFTSKQNTRPATGYVRVGSDVYEFGEGNAAFGTLDFGRGVWPYRVAWNWGSGSGRTDGHLVGLQFGGKWTDGTGLNENGLVVDGRLHKIHDDLVWEYDTADFMKPWRVRDAAGRYVDVALEPFFDRAEGVNLGLLGSRVHQCFGHWSGWIAPEGVGRVEVDGLLGWAEEFNGRW